MNKFAKIFKCAMSAFVVNANAARTFIADPLQSFKFSLAVSGIPASVGFSKVGGMSREYEVIEYLENMFDYTHKLPGREKVGEVTFERGMYAGDEVLWNAFKSIMSEGPGATRRECTINVLDRWGNPRRTFQLAECWFSKFETGEFDASSSEVIIETLTMQFESFLN